MATLFLKITSNNEFDFKFHKQVSGTAIVMTFTPPCACTFMDCIETEFLKTQNRHCMKTA